MSLERYRDLVEMGAPKLPPNWRYVVEQEEDFQSLHIHIEERSYVRRLFRGLQPSWQIIGRQFIVAPYVDGFPGDLFEWETKISEKAAHAYQSALRAKAFVNARDKWEGTHP